MQQFLQYTILGLVVGGVYFIAASGLVVTYTTSGIFNFAHGAVAHARGVHLLAAAHRTGAGPPRSRSSWCCSSSRRSSAPCSRA